MIGKRHFVILMLAFMMSLTVMGQDYGNVSVDLKSAPMLTLFEVIQQQTGLRFIYSSDEIKSIGKITVKAKNESVDFVLSTALKGTGFGYRIKNKIITVKREYKHSQPTQETQGKATVKGRVTDVAGEPLAGVTVIIKGSNPPIGCATNENGDFWLDIPKDIETILTFRFVGMKTRDVACNGKKHLKIVLDDDVAVLKGAEVVGNGMFQRKTETFTGSAITYEGEKLKVFGSQNVIASLKNIDPSFIVTENIDMEVTPIRCRTSP